MPDTRYTIVAVIGYVLGSLSLSYIFSKMHGRDIRNEGTGALGASNTTLSLGFKYGAAVAVHDILKAVMAVLIAEYVIMPEDLYAPYIAGTAAIIGHIFPAWLGFRGGKGFACLIGFTAAIQPIFALCILLAALVVAFITDKIVAATTLWAIAFPVYFIIQNEIIICAIISVGSIVILLKHIPNYKKMIQGTEPSLRKSLGKQK